MISHEPRGKHGQDRQTHHPPAPLLGLIALPATPVALGGVRLPVLYLTAAVSVVPALTAVIAALC